MKDMNASALMPAQHLLRFHQVLFIAGSVMGVFFFIIDLWAKIIADNQSSEMDNNDSRLVRLDIA